MLRLDEVYQICGIDLEKVRNYTDYLTDDSMDLSYDGIEEARKEFLRAADIVERVDKAVNKLYDLAETDTERFNTIMRTIAPDDFGEWDGIFTYSKEAIGEIVDKAVSQNISVDLQIEYVNV